MRIILVIAGFLITSVCSAQDTLFRIISVKGIVLLDGDTVKCGERITTSSRRLVIKGKADYATILTEKGFAFQLNKGKYSVAEIFTSDESNIRAFKVWFEDLNVIKIADHFPRNYFLFGDSLTVIARSTQNNVSQYRLVITNAYDEKVYDSVSTSHVQIVNISGFYGKDRFVGFHVEGENHKTTSLEHGAKELQPKDKVIISYDFACIQKDDFISQELSILALCEIHGLYLDQVHHLYKLWKYSQSTGVEISHPYYKRLFKDYKLDKFLPVPKSGY